MAVDFYYQIGVMDQEEVAAVAVLVAQLYVAFGLFGRREECFNGK